MVIAPRALFNAVHLQAIGSVPWGTPVPTAAAGVYVVAVHGDADGTHGADPLRVDRDVLARWLAAPGHVRLHGAPTTSGALAAHVARWWLPDQPVLYIGKATSLRQRVAAYYNSTRCP